MTKRENRELEQHLLGAALRYAAVADWFESRPVSRRRLNDDVEAMDKFNQAEAELREAGGRLLRRWGHRGMVLQAAGISYTPRA